MIASIVLCAVRTLSNLVLIKPCEVDTWMMNFLEMIKTQSSEVNIMPEVPHRW